MYTLQASDYSEKCKVNNKLEADFINPLKLFETFANGFPRNYPQKGISSSQQVIFHILRFLFLKK